MAVGDQGGPPPHIGFHESFNRGGGIVGDHGEANAARTGVEIFGVLHQRLGLIAVAVDRFDGPDHDTSSISGLEGCIAFAEGNFCLIDFDDAFQWLAIRINHRTPQLLGQQPGVSGSLDRCITVPAVIEVCRPQPRHSYKRGRLFRAATRRSPQTGQTKPSGQRRLNKKVAQLASSENAFWNWESERALAIISVPTIVQVRPLKTL